MIFPGRFLAKPPSKFEDRLITYAPPQLLALFVIGLFAPGGLLEYALFAGHFIVGTFGLSLWIPLLWLLLVKVHNMGRFRFWLSAPTVIVVHVSLALWFAQLR